MPAKLVRSHPSYSSLISCPSPIHSLQHQPDPTFAVDHKTSTAKAVPRPNGVTTKPENSAKLWANKRIDKLAKKLYTVVHKTNVSVYIWL